MKEKASLKKYSLLLLSIIVMLNFSISVTANERAYFAKNNYTVSIGKTISPELLLLPGETAVKWKSNNKKVAKVSQQGRVKGKKKGTAKILVITSFGRVASCKVKVKAKQNQNTVTRNRKTRSSSGGTVYWTPNGSVYHYSRNCPTLSRSKTVYSGSASESGMSRGCRVCG